MKWSDIVEFIKVKDPSFLTNAQGVPLADIQKVEKQRGLKLPQIYVDFLQTMGKHDGGSVIFGNNYLHDFYNLNQLNPDEPPRSKRYFKIADHDETNDMAYMSTFLDLDRSDGQDAPLVEDEENYPKTITPETADDTNDTLSVVLESRVFRYFETAKRKEELSLILHLSEYKDGVDKTSKPGETYEEYMAKLKPFSPKSAKERMGQIMAVLEKYGLKLALPELPTYACMSRADLSATVDIAGELNLIAVNLSRDEKSDTDTIVDDLEKTIPGLKVYETWHKY